MKKVSIIQGDRASVQFIQIIIMFAIYITNVITNCFRAKEYFFRIFQKFHELLYFFIFCMIRLRS